MSLHTPLCDLLGIEHPILQAGMAGAAGPDLVAAVSNAGGLGILPGLNLPPDTLRQQIRAVRALTSRPFGVNLWLHADMWPPVDVARVAASTVQAVRDALNRLRAQRGLPASSAAPTSSADIVGAAFDVIVEERVPVFTAAVGEPTPEMVRRCHAHGAKVVAMVTTVHQARAVAGAGVDVLVAQGSEAGGHRSLGVKPDRVAAAGVGTLALVPQVVDAVRVPVVAAGGIADGRGLVAVLALGAQGAQVGTRFVATREGTAAEFRKKAVLEAESEDTAITDVVSGLWSRYIRNAYIDEYEKTGAPVLPVHAQSRFAQDIFDDATKREDAAWLPLATGQSAGLVRDLPTAAEVVERIAREAQEVLVRLRRQGGAP
ncbi:MAG TPA: nitronate monooxygenase [Methylomirabilota bacterium]|jgi:nitronate monooxygenase|nr:nitronate monooxygenase [Methylomirabilota bacterium]